MASQLPLVIGSEQSLPTEELEAGTEGFSPDRLLQRSKEGNNESKMVLPPPLEIVPEQQSLSMEELIAGTEGFSPDRLLQRPKEGSIEGILVLPPPRAIAPKQPLSTELVGGTAGSSPDRLLQRPNCQPGIALMPSLTMVPQRSPPPPQLRRVVCYCCSSDPKEKQKATKECAGCIGSAVRSGCCLLAASLAILITYWSLFPMCTTCDDGVLSTSSPSSAAEIAAMTSSSTGDSVRPFSTLRINQLQVTLYSNALIV